MTISFWYAETSSLRFWHHRSGDGLVVVFDSRSGGTHVISDVAEQIVLACGDRALSLESLVSLLQPILFGENQIAVKQLVEAHLQQLLRAGLVSVEDRVA